MSISFDHSKEWYRTDLHQNVLDYIKRFEEFYIQAQEEESFWKWVIIAWHGALYHLMLDALRNTDGSGVYKKEIRDASGHIDFSQEEEMDLISFHEAFGRLKQNERMSGYVGSKSYISDASTDKAMDDLNYWRNSFIHYKPKGWSIGIEIFRKIIEDSLPVLAFLTNDCIRISWEQSDREAVNNIIKRINKNKTV